MAKKKEEAKECDKVKEASEEEVIQSELDMLSQELEKQKDLLLRTAAEFDNFKKRSERERESLGAFVKAQTLKALIPAVDNLSRSLEADSSAPDYVKGVELTVAGLLETLKKEGLTEINPVGEPFDPLKHEAVIHIEDETLGENVVAEVLQKGYALGEQVLRAAMVKVAN